jgi:hypothetical protein
VIGIYYSYHGRLLPGCGGVSGADKGQDAGRD